MAGGAEGDAKEGSTGGTPVSPAGGGVARVSAVTPAAGVATAFGGTLAIAGGDVRAISGLAGEGATRAAIRGGAGGVGGHSNQPPATASATSTMDAVIAHPGTRDGLAPDSGDLAPDEGGFVSLTVLSSSTGCGILALL